MYKIGEFSKLCQLSVKTLRYYAEINLLKPEFQDHFTGYRYYSAKQLPEVERIQALKELGFSLEEIREAAEDSLSVIENREQNIHRQIYELRQQLRRLEASKELWIKEDMPMFHVRIKEQRPVSVNSTRQIFPTRREVLEMLDQHTGKKEQPVIVINYENEFRSDRLDLEIALVEKRGKKILFQGTGIPGDDQTDSILVASLVCERELLDDAYSYLIRYLKEGDEYQMIGNSYEWYIGGQTVELQIPVHELHGETEEPRSDDTQLLFENDEAVVGHWKVVTGDCRTEESFNPSHVNWTPMEGDIRELYFLPEGKKYWFYRWTKGILLSQFGVPLAEGQNPYTIKEIAGKKYMFLWFKDRDCFFRGALPELIVLEQLDNRHYDKEELRVRDILPEGFEEDLLVHGKWKVCDFVKQPANFRVGEYNAGFPKDKLFFKHILFCAGGTCRVQYGEEWLSSPDIDWTKGFLRDRKSKVLQRYERQVLEGTEYLFVEFKSGDYFYNHQQPWWYVFTREAE